MLFFLVKQLIPIRNCFKYREDGEFLIVLADTMEIFYLNAVAKDFYLAIDHKKSIKDIFNELLLTYNVEAEILSRDIVTLVRDLQWNQLIRLEEVNVNESL